MASLNFVKINTLLFVVTIACEISVSRAQNDVPTIAAEPAVLPYPPVSSPDFALTPDIFPQFPTPAIGSPPPPPSKSSLPIIPSNPSPPDPESLASPHPQFSISPTGSLLESSAFAPKVSNFLAMVVVVLPFLLFW